MFIQFALILTILAIIIFIGEVTRKKGFDNLKISRNIDKDRLLPGEEFTLTTTIENNKRLPISFLMLSEKMPAAIEFVSDSNRFKEGADLWHLSKYAISWYERKRRIYKLKCNVRGTYILRDINVTIGDLFGHSAETVAIEDFLEFLVYPKLININNIQFANTNLQGDNYVKRWIHQDPLYIKGIREYNVEDRMKDIHWKSSLKMDKLMVKEYDFTSERELTIIVNGQCGEPYWGSIQPVIIENGITVAASLASIAIKEGVASGMWTNCQLMGIQTKISSEVSPDINALRKIMELSARISYSITIKFSDYLRSKIKEFSPNSTYVIITSYLDEESVGILSKLKRHGILIKVIDVSLKSSVPYISGIEKMDYKGGV
ncbi:DUF58 domain-containing protein [Clostridium estertheticum]|uniref:DUF58 domain-containing protein n=1 Tax=Clostridium estertheticum TaxID=238834 RepID=UPI0013E95EDB|nr:DUF58 domain-containing protein [Clostridium estertheticum]MBZ9689169.1 DUF58 domain-containing protein [Clostridium estertheticum]